MKKITEYKREEIQAMVRSGIAAPQTLRDYDIIMALQQGKKYSQITSELNTSKRTIIRAKDRFAPEMKGEYIRE